LSAARDALLSALANASIAGSIALLAIEFFPPLLHPAHPAHIHHKR
jgi:hypothetical protein